MSKDERDKVERLLDDALASYSRQEPRPGLERRVLDRIHTGASPGIAFPRWAWAIPAAACLLWAGILWTRHVATPHRPQVRQVAVTREIAPPRAETPRIVNHVHKRKALPKQPQFPASAPLTNEERALLAFVTHAPKEAQEALIDAQQHSAEPIRIEKIEIQPLK